MFGMFTELMRSVINEAEEFVDDPIGKSVEIAAQPVVDAIDIIDGLTEGELRYKAAMRLGADAAAGMALGELISWYENS